MLMSGENKTGPNANLAYIWIAIAGAGGAAAVAFLGGRFDVGFVDRWWVIS
jgi:hypothetical protein